MTERAFEILDDVAILVRASKLEAARVREIASFARDRGQSIIELLVDREGVDEISLISNVASLLDLPSLLEPPENVDEAALTKVPPALAIRHHVMPLGFKDGRLQLACWDPFDWQGWDELRHLLGCPMDRVLSPRPIIDRLLKSHYGIGAGTVQRLLAGRAESAATVLRTGSINLSEEEEANEPTVVNLVNQILTEAIRAAYRQFVPPPPKAPAAASASAANAAASAPAAKPAAKPAANTPSDGSARAAGGSADDRLVIYLFGGRGEWSAFTQGFVPAQAHVYLHIHSGGYMDQRTATSVVFDLGRDRTLSLLAHEGLHQYLARNFPLPVPAWLNEGLAAQFEDFDLDGARPVFRPRRNLGRKNSLREALVLENGWLPLPRLLAMDAGDAVVKTGQPARGYYAQVWATVLFLRESPRYRPGFTRLLADAGTGRLRTAIRAYRAATPAAAGMSDGEVAFRRYVTENLDDFAADCRTYARGLVQ